MADLRVGAQVVARTSAYPQGSAQRRVDGHRGQVYGASMLYIGRWLVAFPAETPGRPILALLHPDNLEPVEH